MNNVPNRKTSDNQGSANRSLRRDAQTNLDALCSRVKELQQVSPFEYEGVRWAPKYSRKEWAAELGTSIRTFDRLTEHEPLSKLTIGWGRDRVTLLRVGDMPDTLTLHRREVAKDLRWAWINNTKHDFTSKKDFGLLFGLASDLPDGCQKQVVMTALKNWPLFMDGVKLEVDVALRFRAQGINVTYKDALQDHCLMSAYLFRNEELYQRVYKWPCLGFLRKFHHVATDIWWGQYGKPNKGDLAHKWQLYPH